MSTINLLDTTSALYERVKRVIPQSEWLGFASDIEAILELKRKRNAVILAHNYQTPEIFHCVADITGDSVWRWRGAPPKTDADIIVHGWRTFHGRDGQDA